MIGVGGLADGSRLFVGEGGGGFFFSITWENEDVV